MPVQSRNQSDTHPVEQTMAERDVPTGCWLFDPHVTRFMYGKPQILLNTHCSNIIRVLDDVKDLFQTW